MKKHITRLLYDLGFKTLAYRVSPEHYNEYWAENTARTIQEAIDKISLFATAMGNATDKIQETNNDVHKPN